MANNFNGFDPDGFLLLELNKFNDSKEFYETVKEDIKSKIITPMRQLALDLSEELIAVDDKMVLIPTKMVSRIRRDTRYSKNKEMYRSNVWCMFMRNKHEWRFMPCMWFEVFPDSYSYGVGLFHAQPSDLETFREFLLDNQDEFRYALRQMDVVGAYPFIDTFKKDKPGAENVEEDIRKYYNSRYFLFSYTGTDMRKVFDGSIKEELIYAIRAFTPMYKFLLNVTEEIYTKGD
ncbi:MAG: DUF2461 domain-containing protein [Clostridia bacterium]|nr:DUF2461 domain-containing protein [Clostridia bacterium]